ncbi:MAG TPA: hypothetical protein VJH68_03410 [Candidatus Nanoarchaeia archaeon]|nr:hypothetical protein [Candidatus Nanoarchaeia archaeon]
MNIKKGILIMAIALILAFFVGYGIEVFDPTPDYDQFYRKFNSAVYTEQECLAQDGYWRADQPVKSPPKLEAVEGEEAAVVGYCEVPYDKIELEKAQHDKIVFIVAIIAGLIAVISGLLLNKDTISTGIVTGGVLLLLYGTIRYWRHANNILKFILLGIVLAVLIWIAYQKMDKNK